MDEDVVAAVLLRDEAEALLGVEPLHGALSHALFLLYTGRGTATSAALQSAGETPSRLASHVATEKKRRRITNSAGVVTAGTCTCCTTTVPTPSPDPRVGSEIGVIATDRRCAPASRTTPRGARSRSALRTRDPRPRGLGRRPFWAFSGGALTRSGWGILFSRIGRRGRILGPLAQLAEQRTFNPRVVGSSPTGPTNRRSATWRRPERPSRAPDWGRMRGRMRHCSVLLGPVVTAAAGQGCTPPAPPGCPRCSPADPR